MRTVRDWHATDRQGNSQRQAHRPVVQRGAPQLPRVAERVGGHAADGLRRAVRPQLEQVLAGPHVRALPAHVDWHVAHQLDAGFVRVVLPPATSEVNQGGREQVLAGPHVRALPAHVDWHVAHQLDAGFVRVVLPPATSLVSQGGRDQVLVRWHVSAQPVHIYRHAVYEVKACFVRKPLLTQDSEYE